mmetsp:Transcript_46218/g.88989  ORF Transcript_46218/g.88989 Transcript_46218/m.88989 type:complete len:90 (+) Transcript_46218:54-323(+)
MALRMLHCPGEEETLPSLPSKGELSSAATCHESRRPLPLRGIGSNSAPEVFDRSSRPDDMERNRPAGLTALARVRAVVGGFTRTPPRVR